METENGTPFERSLPVYYREYPFGYTSVNLPSQYNTVIQMKEISAVKFHNNRKEEKKMLEDSVNSIGQFLKFIGHYAY